MLSSRSRHCRNAAILGGSVCAKHGGSAPQVRRSARERLEALVDPAIDGLRAAMKSGDVGAIVRAATVVLDRTGLAPRYVMEVEQRAVDRLREEERVVLFAALDEIHKVKKPMPAAHFVEILRRHLNGAEEAQRAAPTL